MRISFARRSSRFSHPITDACGLVRGHPGIELRRCRPGGPAPVRLRPGAELVCHPGDLTGLRLALGGTLADEAHGVLVLSGGVARRRRAVRARVARPAALGCVVMAPPPTHGEALQGNR